jgi:hypothetical protein
MLDQRTQQRLRSALPLLLATLPAVFIALAICHYGVDTPVWDEWLTATYLDRFAQGTLTARDLFQQQNEYRQFFPNLIFVGLGWITGWDVRSWMAASFLCAGVISFWVYRLGKWTLPENPGRARWCWFIANLIIFSPVQHENWLQGQQLVYFLPIACFTTALWFASAGNFRNSTKFLVCAAASIIASFSAANGMLCWILLLPVLAWSSSKDELRRKLWWIAAWIAAFLSTLACYFHDYHTPVQHDPLALTRANPAEIASYYLSTLGRSLAPGRFFVAAAVGLVILALFCWSCLQFWNLRKRSQPQAERLLAWLMLGSYSILTAVLLTVGRLEHGVGQNLAASRYTTYTLYLPVALVYLLPSLLKKDSQQLFPGLKVSTTRLLATLGAVVIVMHLLIYLLGVRQMSSFRVGALYSKSCSMFVNVVDEPCLTKVVFPRIELLKRNINAAERLGLLRPGLVKGNRVEDIAAPQDPGSSEQGAFESLSRAHDGSYIASGWAKLPDRGEPADAVLLAYAEDDNSPIIFAIVPVNTERDIISTLFRRGSYGDSHWSRYFSPGGLNLDRTKLTAWGFDAYSGKAYKLNGEHTFQKLAGP